MLRCGQAEARIRSARGSYKKVPANLTDSHAYLWADQSQNRVRPWQFIPKDKADIALKILEGVTNQWK